MPTILELAEVEKEQPMFVTAISLGGVCFLASMACLLARVFTQVDIPVIADAHEDVSLGSTFLFSSVTIAGSCVRRMLVDSKKEELLLAHPDIKKILAMTEQRLVRENKLVIS
jgi:hypothetical protein